MLEAGKWQNPWSGIVSCSIRACEAKLQLDESDIQVRGYRDEPYFQVTCAICGHQVNLKKEDLPQRITEKLNLTLKYRPSSQWD